MPPAGGDAGALRGLYREVSSHLDGCEIKVEYLSDTWRHTLKQKGRLHPFEDMLSMLAVGNRVNSWIDDFNYLNDVSVLAEKNPILRRILEIGPVEFGRPRKQLKIGRRDVSSQFVQQALYASRIIGAIKARGITEPVVMEIGGGLGGLARLLRAYYGDRLTYYAVDLPETLAIQEWYLRACFPGAPTTYKGARKAVKFERGGLNFINAYVLESQNIGIDVAVNIDSMQEMNADAVGAYVRYFEANLSERGLFYFQNHFGHSSAGISEPSDYPLDGRWTLAAAQVVPQIEVCSEGIQLRLILHRTARHENPATRRLVLRTLWNAFMSGWPAHSPRLIEALGKLPGVMSPAAAVAPIVKAFRDHGIPLKTAAVSRLMRSPYWSSARDFVTAYDTRPSPSTELGFTLSCADAVWRTQSSLLALMQKAAGPGVTPAAARRKIAEIVKALHLPAAAGSDYWSAYVAAILLALRQDYAGRAALGKAIKRSDNQHWLVRFAHLAAHFGLDAEREQALTKLHAMELDDIVALKTAELTALRQPEKAEALLKSVFAQAVEVPKLWSLARTAARIGNIELAADVTASILRRCSDISSETIFGVLRACPKGLPRAGLKTIARGLPRPAAGRLQEEYEVFYGFILVELGENQRGLKLAKQALQRFKNDYFRLGQLGRLLQGAGRPDLADRALRRSLALRPGTFLHHEFVGDVYLSGKRFQPARRELDAALRLRPYPRHIQAKKLYCDLPPELRELGVFGRPSDWNIIFQRRHDFYHDIGPSTK